MTAFAVGSILFFIVGFLCGHICQRKKRVAAWTISQSDHEKIQHTPYYDDVVLKQEQELELRENVAYAPVR